jgi:hypothetical protein
MTGLIQRPTFEILTVTTMTNEKRYRLWACLVIVRFLKKTIIPFAFGSAIDCRHERSWVLSSNLELYRYHLWLSYQSGSERQNPRNAKHVQDFDDFENAGCDRPTEHAGTVLLSIVQQSEER